MSVFFKPKGLGGHQTTIRGPYQDAQVEDVYSSIISGSSSKLNLYLKNMEESEGINKQLPDWLWVQCDLCFKWRRLPKGTDKDSLPNRWYCHLNPYNSHNRCETAEEPDHEYIPYANGGRVRKKGTKDSNVAADLKLPSPVAAEKVLNKQGTVTQATPQQSMTLPPSIHLLPAQTAARNILNKRQENVDTPEEIMTLPRSIHLIRTQTAARNILKKRQENVSAPNVVAASSSLPDVSTPNTVTVGEKKITKKRKNVSNDPLQTPSTSSSGDNTEPLPKRANLTDKIAPQDVAQNILASIKKKKQGVPNQTSTNRHSTAHNSIATQTDILTTFHRNVHELMIIMKETDPGNVEDIETVVASVLEWRRLSAA